MSDEKDLSSDASVQFFRRLDTLLWGIIGIAIIAGGSTLYDLKLQSVIIEAKVNNIDKSVERMVGAAALLQQHEARIAQMENNWEHLWPWRRAAQQDLATIWRAIKLEETPAASQQQK